MSGGSAMSKAPDGGWGWWIVFASFGCNVVVDGIGFSFGVLIGDLVGTFNASRAETALVGSLLCGMYLLNAPIAGLLVKRFGCRVVAMTGAVIASVGFLLSAFSTSLTFLIVAYGGLGGFGFGFIYLPSIVSVGFYFEKRRAMATGIALSGSGLGTIICSSLAKGILDAEGWRYALAILACLILNCAVLGALMRPLSEIEIVIDESGCPDEKDAFKESLRLSSNPEYIELSKSDPVMNMDQLVIPRVPAHQSHTDVYSSKAVPCSGRELMLKKDIFYSGSFQNLPSSGYAEVEVVEGKFSTIRNIFNDMFDLAVLRNWKFMMIVFGNVFGMLGMFVPYVYLTDRAVLLGVAPVQAALLVSVLGISNGIGRIACGIISDLPCMKALWVNNVCLLISAISTAVCPFVTSYSGMVVFAAFTSSSISGFAAVTPVILCDIMGVEKLTSCFSLLTLIRGIAVVAGAPIAGMIFDVTRSYDISFYYGGAMLMICFMFHAVLLIPFRRTSADEENS